MAITLFGERLWYSPYVFSTFVALQEKGLEFAMRELDLATGEHRRGDYPARSLTGRVPALEHDGFVLSESTAIVEYLDETFGPPRARLLPDEPKARARARQIMAWIRSDLLALREERPTTTMFFERATGPLSDAGRDAADALLRVSTAVIPPGATTMFGAWSIADADLGFMLHRLILNGHDVPAAIRAYAEAQWSRPSVRAFVEHPRPPR
jgi:glutathione S-transferase